MWHIKVFDNIVLKPTQEEIASFSPQTTKETIGFHVMQPFAKPLFKRCDKLLVDSDIVGLGNKCGCTLLDFESCSKWSSAK